MNRKLRWMVGSSGCWLLLPFAILQSSAAFGFDRPILELVPADCVAVWSARPYADWTETTVATTGPGDRDTAGSHLIAILTFMNASGLIPREGQVFADIAARLPLLGRYEHALALLDVSSRVVRRRDGSESSASNSLRLNSLQAAVVFRTGGHNKDILTHLDRVVGRYTNTERGRLSTEKAGDIPYQRLVDDRMTGWAVWEWGRLDDFYVITFGAGAFERIAKVHSGAAPSLAADPWFQSATRKTHGDKALAQWFISLSRLERNLANIAGPRYRDTVKALQADRMTHDLWTIGREGRAMSWYRCFRRDGKDETRAYSDPENHPADLRGIVPPQAKRFAIINVPTDWLVSSLPKAWVQAQSEGHVRRLTAAWERLEQETGIDIGKNLLEHLGQNVVIFDYPAHPLRIPVALTVAIEITDRKAVETATDALLGAWSRYLDERARRKETPLVRIRVRRADDGVWYIQAGILGPALKVTDRFLVISWSPNALRDALPYAERLPARP